jgi:hypothetical protein
MSNNDIASSESEIIEERKKDADGQIVVNKYIKGKLLGKVNVMGNHNSPLSPYIYNLVE